MNEVLPRERLKENLAGFGRRIIKESIKSSIKKELIKMICN